PPPIGEYFDSPHPTGARRTAHIVEQAAFFTVRHASTMATVCLMLTALCFGIGVALLWLVANGQASPSAEPAFTQAAGALLAFVPTSEFLSLWSGYTRLRSVARRAVEHCGALARQESPDDEHVAFVVGSYDAGLAQGPPVPGLIYRLERDRLERAWAQHEAGPLAPASGGQHG
ncbi:MAG: hypothetical protein KC492_41540, partial [Myxococcales bacterium]|nr:hypothetical protein [Myxococcales bacterium]